MEFSEMKFTEPDMSHSYSGLHRDTVLKLVNSTTEECNNGYTLHTEDYRLYTDDSKFITLYAHEDPNGIYHLEICGTIVREDEVMEVYGRSAMEVYPDDFDDARGKMLADAYGYIAMFIW